jgi:hypothetical protein
MKKKVDKTLLWILVYIACSSAALGYMGTDESFKYVNAALRFWLIGFFIVSNSGAIAAKAFFTEDERDPTDSEKSIDAAKAKQDVAKTEQTTATIKSETPVVPVTAKDIVTSLIDKAIAQNVQK